MPLFDGFHNRVNVSIHGMTDGVVVPLEFAAVLHVQVHCSTPDLRMRVISPTIELKHSTDDAIRAMPSTTQQVNTKPFLTTSHVLAFRIQQNTVGLCVADIELFACGSCLLR